MRLDEEDDDYDDEDDEDIVFTDEPSPTTTNQLVNVAVHPQPQVLTPINADVNPNNEESDASVTSKTRLILN